jgi:hypothetical protein
MTDSSNNDEILKTLKDATAFPLWVENVDTVGDKVGGSTASGGSVGKLVAKTISDTLGWRVRPNDPKGFLAALTNSFQLEEKKGVVLAKWTPHNLSIQADLGQLSGAQASLAARSKVITDIVKPMLEGLKALQPDSDPEDGAALITLISSNLQKINDEMWRIGGPVVQQVDQLFTILFGEVKVRDNRLKEPQHVEGQLGDLRDLFGYGYDAGYVNTVDDETHLTNFMVVINYIDMLRVIWGNQRQVFLGNGKFFGTQLILLSRDLDVVAQGVDEVNFAMDSVLLGAAERQSLRLHLPGEAPLTFANLLDEGIGQWALTDGKYILQYGGKDGVQSTFIPLLNNLLRLLSKLIETTPPNRLPAGFYAPRVQITLKNLERYMRQTLKDAKNIKRDRVKLVDHQELTNVVGGLNDTVASLEFQIKTLASSKVNGDRGHSPATMLQVLGEVVRGEPRAFRFVPPNEQVVNRHPSIPADITIEPRIVTLAPPDPAWVIELTINASTNAQPGTHIAFVNFTRPDGSTGAVLVQFTVI